MTLAGDMKRVCTASHITHNGSLHDLIVIQIMPATKLTASTIFILPPFLKAPVFNYNKYMEMIEKYFTNFE